MIQEYFFSKQLTSECQLQLAVMDWERQGIGAGEPNVGATRWINPDTLTATVYYDPNAKTVRFTGSLSLKGSTDVSLSFSDKVQIASNLQTANVTVRFSFPAVLFFDSGELALNGATVQFIPPSIPVIGLYTILVDGQTLTGRFGYDLYFQTTLIPITNITPESLVIGQNQSRFAPQGPPIVRGLTAPNGMIFTMVGGISDGTYSSSWNMEQLTAQRRSRAASPTNAGVAQT